MNKRKLFIYWAIVVVIIAMGPIITITVSVIPHLWYVIFGFFLIPFLLIALNFFIKKKWIGQKKQRLVQIQIKMNEYNDLHLKARNMRLELEGHGYWMCLAFIVPETIGLGTGNHAHGLLLPPCPSTNAYPAYPEFQDPSGFKDQPEQIYGTAIPCEPVMPDQQNDGWEQPMIDMY